MKFIYKVLSFLLTIPLILIFTIFTLSNSNITFISFWPLESKIFIPVWALSLSFFFIGLFGYAFSRIYIWIDYLNLQENLFYKSLCIYFFWDFLFGMGVVSTIQQILFFTLFPLMTYFLFQNVRLSQSRSVT